MSSRVAVLMLLATFGCDDEPPPPVAASVTVRPRRPVMAPRHVATPASFDLVSTSGGPLLVWGLPATEGGSIRAVPLTRFGDAAAPSRHVASHDAPYDVLADAMELDAAAGGGRLGVMWIWRNPIERRAAATLGDDGAEAFAPPRDLGVIAHTGRVSQRGLVAAAAASSGEVAVVHRGGEGPCETGQETQCIEIGVSRLAPGETERGGVPLALPAPCAKTIVGYEHVDGVWYYGLCDESEGRTTIVFAIQFEPQYAHAERALSGCEPRGMTTFGDTALTLADCPDGVRGLRLGDAARSVSPVSGAPTVHCRDGKPSIELDGTQMALEAPRDGLALLLPERIASGSDRAVWTGDAILVAGITGNELGIRRWECIDGRLRRTDLE